MSELTIHIPIGDWYESAKVREAVVATTDDILERIDQGDYTAEIACDYIVSRETGQADDDTIAPNKILLLNGASYEVSKIVRAQKRKVRTKNDDEDAPLYIGKVGRPCQDELGRSYIRYDDPGAIQRVEDYILKVVTGHIRNRLPNYRDNGGDIRELGERLKRKIDEMVNRFDV